MKNLIEGEEEFGDAPDETAGGGEGGDSVDPLTGYKPLKFKDPMELSFLAPLPFKFATLTIPNFAELRTTWRMGI